MDISLNFLLLFFGSLLLPLLAVFALLLRQSLVTGKMKTFIFFVAIISIIVLLYEEFLKHGKEFGVFEMFIAIIASFVTYLMLSRLSSHHTHSAKDAGIKGLVLAEAFHSLFDGLAIGVAFLATPLIGIGALAGIIMHELPKMVATLALIRASGLSMKKTVLYGAFSQAGVPVAACLVYLLGTSIETEFHFVDAAVISSLATVILFILYKEVKHHKKGLSHDHHEH
jgi:zinc transporter ZupT